MADDTKKLELQILTKYFGAGAAQAIVDQEKLAGSTKDLGAKTAEATDAAKEHVKHMEGAGKVFGVLNRLVPELGHALHAAFLGPLGPIILVGLAVSEVRSRLAEYNEELDKIPEEELAKHQSAIADLQTAWDNAKTAEGKYQAALMHAGEDNDPIATAIKREKELEAARMEGSKRLIEQLGKEEEAAIRRNGALNFEETDVTNKKVQAARDATQDKLKSVDQQKDSPTVPLLQAEYARRIAQRDQLATREKQTADAAFEAEQKFSRHQKELADARKEKEADLEKAQTALEFAKAPTVKDPLSGVYTPADPADIAKAEEELKRATAERDNAKRREDQLNAGITPEAKAKAEADLAAENAKAANIQNQKRIIEIPGELTQQQSIEALRRNPNANVPSPLGKLDAVPTIAPTPRPVPYEQTPEGKARFDWSQLDAARDVLSHGGQLDQRQEQMIKAILTAATGQAVKHDKILEVLNAINADNKTRDADFDRLVSALHRVDQTASRALEAAYNH